MQFVAQGERQKAENIPLRRTIEKNNTFSVSNGLWAGRGKEKKIPSILKSFFLNILRANELNVRLASQAAEDDSSHGAR